MNYNAIQTALKSTYPDQHFVKVEVLQSLWSGYGEIARFRSEETGTTVIAKLISPPGSAVHPRGWNTTTSHQRKLTSYQNERHFYAHYTQCLTDESLVARPIAISGDMAAGWILMQDLDASGFYKRSLGDNLSALHSALQWLANFHSTFLNVKGVGLSPRGTYWYLATRQDEWNAMPDGPLKTHAADIDKRLAHCRLKTLLHGDAKVANFCFSADWNTCAAVDFQYTGLGCGIQDVVYLLGSVLDNQSLAVRANDLIDEYFACLLPRIAKLHGEAVATEVEKEWRHLVPFAWADFERFLLGWSPSHKKLTAYSQEQVKQALALLD
ncbi:phosphotransferase [Alteromonas facilis]|uniref:phosphotransferase n=1 Tax=Alteromonas facilis TaxID=2048004 RepID=UPI000C28E24B|nr:phosphotransferase [Alteromonas facilis]